MCVCGCLYENECIYVQIAYINKSCTAVSEYICAHTVIFMTIYRYAHAYIDASIFVTVIKECPIKQFWF